MGPTSTKSDTNEIDSNSDTVNGDAISRPLDMFYIPFYKGSNRAGILPHGKRGERAHRRETRICMDKRDEFYSA